MPSLEKATNFVKTSIEKGLCDLEFIGNEELARNSSVNVTYASSERVTIPEVIPPSKLVYDQLPAEYESPPLRIFELDNCIISAKGIISTSGRKIILESTRSKQYRFVNLLKSIVKSKSECIEFKSDPHEYIFGEKDEGPEKGLFMSLVPYNGWENNYYHWILEILPQIRAFEKYSLVYNREPTLIIPCGLPNFATDFLSLVGLSSTQWIELSSDSIFVEKLVLPEARYWSGSEYSATRSEIDWLRSRLLPGTQADKFSHCDRIYISRSDANNRNVKNNKQVTNLLEDFGFEKYVLSEYTAEQQMNIFRNASKVVAPHGAGLVNTIFGNSIEVFEFVGYKNQRLFFALLSGIIDQKYKALLCNKVGGINGDYVVELGKLKKEMIKMDYSI